MAGKRYTTKSSIGKSISSIENRADMRAKFSKELIDAFIEVKRTEFDNEEVYQKFNLLAQKYLGKNAEDGIESGKLIVLLSKATMDLFDRPEKKLAAKTRLTNTISCIDHPTYRAIRKPRKDCGSCWAMYNSTRIKCQNEEQKNEDD